MAQEIMLALGDYQFSINTAAYDKLQRQTTYHWQSHERFGQGPALQFTGWGDEKIDLSGVIYPEYRGGLTQLDTMRANALKGTPFTLVSGTGFVLGDWVITDVHEGQSIFAQAGIPLKLEFSLSLKRYDTDADAPQQSSHYEGGTWGGPYDPGPTPGEVHPAPTTEQTYVTREGDILSQVLSKVYGNLKNRVVERVYGYNLGLADLGASLPAGVKLLLPPLPGVISGQQLVRLWT